MRMLQFVEVPVAKCVANAEDISTDYQLRQNQSYLNTHHKRIIFGNCTSIVEKNLCHINLESSV